MPSHALVHYGLEVLCHNARPCRLGEAVGHVVRREQVHRLGPCVTVGRCLQHRLSRRLMLAAWVGEVVHIELAVPVSHHRLVVVEPTRLAAHGLHAVHTHHGRQSAVVACRRCNGLACVVHRLAVIFFQCIYKLLVGHEHRAVLVADGEFHSSRLVLEVHEVFGPVCAVNLVAV